MSKHLLYIGSNDLFKMLVAIYLKSVKVSFYDAINKMVLGHTGYSTKNSLCFSKFIVFTTFVLFSLLYYYVVINITGYHERYTTV